MQIFFSKSKLTEEPIEEDFSLPSIQEELDKTRYALEIAYAGFDNAIEPDMIDCYIFEINALLKKYKFLSDQAAEENIVLKQDSYPQSPIHALVSHVFS